MKGIYKAKTIDSNVWVEGFYAYSISYNAHYIIVDEQDDISRFTDYEIEPSTLCQRTNKTDKNGVQVFDGDICYDDLREFNVFISYNEYSLRWLIVGDSWDCPLEPYWFQYLSVVGNVHDNPELLK